VAASSTTLRVRDFCDLWCVAATATSAYQLASHVRVKKIEMWAPMASDLVPVTISCDWSGSTSAGVYGKSNRVSDTSIGSSDGAHIVTRPPAGSQIAQWISTAGGTLTLCDLSYPINTIIDVTYELVVKDDGAATAVTGAVAGATVGANYIRSLDSGSATNLVPLSYSTI